ncbi:hypothetical protein JW877_10160, partial [bacterium]|nr:hypothetical protein [bacterium]
MNKTLLLFIVLVLSVNLVEGVGLSVAPGTILIEDFPVGDFYDFQEERNYTIRIRNGDDTPHTYTLKAERPSESESRATGFYDIPYPEWFYLEVETVTVAAGEEENVR